MVLNTLTSTFHAVSANLDAFPARKDILLSWLRNQFLAWGFIGMWMTTYCYFFAAQFFYNDGALFVQFWNTMFQLEPFF